MGYAAYLVRENDSFDPQQFPRLVTDIDEITSKTTAINDRHKADILISFSVNNSLKPDWLEANQAFSALVVKGQLPLKTCRHYLTVADQTQHLRNSWNTISAADLTRTNTAAQPPEQYGSAGFLVTIS